MLKKVSINTVHSGISVLLMNFIFVLWSLFLDMCRPFQSIPTIVIFCALMYLGCVIGRKLTYEKGLSEISVLVLPLLIFVLLYCISSVLIPTVGNIIEYPAVIWGEALNIFSKNDLTMFFRSCIHYFICLLTIFIGCYKHSESDNLD